MWQVQLFLGLGYCSVVFSIVLLEGLQANHVRLLLIRAATSHKLIYAFLAVCRINFAEISV